MTKLNDFQSNSDFPAFGDDTTYTLTLDISAGTTFNGAAGGVIIAESGAVNISPDALAQTIWNVNRSAEWQGPQFAVTTVPAEITISGQSPYSADATIYLLTTRDGRSVKISAVSGMGDAPGYTVSVKTLQDLHVECRLRSFIAPA